MLNKDITFIKRNIKYGEYFGCLFVKWDKQSGKVVTSASSQRIIILSLVLSFCVTFCRLLSTMISASGLLDRAQAGIGAIVFMASFLIRFDVPTDHVSVQLVNFLIRENGMKTIIQFFLEICIRIWIFSIF